MELLNGPLSNNRPKMEKKSQEPVRNTIQMFFHGGLPTDKQGMMVD